MQAARAARVDLGFGLEGPLPDLLAAIEGPGGAHVVVLDLGDDIAGACLQRPPDLVLLFVNGAQAPVRQRFTLAHEFGHRRLGHASVIDRVVDVSAGAKDPSEVAANYFAAEFLIPRPAAERWADGRALHLDDVVRLACAYGVSAKMARVRLETCGVLVDPRADRAPRSRDRGGEPAPRARRAARPRRPRRRPRPGRGEPPSAPAGAARQRARRGAHGRADGRPGRGPGQAPGAGVPPRARRPRPGRARAVRVSNTGLSARPRGTTRRRRPTRPRPARRARRR